MSNHHRATYFGMCLAAPLLMCGCKGPVSPTTNTTVTGVVFEMTSAGQVPVPGALVTNLNSRGSASTDSNGRYTMLTPDSEPMSVEISKWPFESSHQSVTIHGYTVADFEIVRRTTRTLSGVVTEDTPAGPLPVEGAFVEVVVCPTPPVVGQFSLASAKSDENGSYSVSNLCDGATTVFPSKEGYQLAAPTALDRSCDSDGYECRFLTIAGDTRFDIQLIKRN